MSEKLIELPASVLLNKFGAANQTPGSGSAAALQGILSAQLLITVIGLTNAPKRRKQYSAQLPKLLEIESELKERLLPDLERLFQDDSDQFDRVILLRRKNQTKEAREALKVATEMPIQIAKICLELAIFAIDVFDNGFKAALGDSGVALNTALAGVSGCLSIIELNLLSFKSDAWTTETRKSRNSLRTELQRLTEMAQTRLSEQHSKAERNTKFFEELHRIASTAKHRKNLSIREIEGVAVKVQRLIWVNRDLIRNAKFESPFDALNPEVALDCLDFQVDRPATLGQYPSQGKIIEVAGQIDQKLGRVSISRQFPRNTQNFTLAHELGHSLLHTQNILHRDRGLDVADPNENRGSTEWQADKFATYFLMPTKLVKNTFRSLFLTDRFQISDLTAFALNAGTPEEFRKKCRNLRGLSRNLAKTTLYNGAVFNSLSEGFQVSIEAMAIRLEELKLVEF